MGIYEQLAAEHAQRERAQQMAAMAAREAAMREAAQREATQREAVMRAQQAQAQAQQAQAQQARLTQAQRAAAQQAQAARAGQTAAARAGQYPRYQQSPVPVPGQNFAPQQSPGPTSPGYNLAAPAAPMPDYPATPAPGHPAQFAPPAPQSAARAQSAPKAGRLRSKLFGGKRRERTADANQLANRVVGNVANGAQPPLMAPPAPQQRAPQQKAPQQPPAPQPALHSAHSQQALPQPAPSRPAHSRPLSQTAANIPAPAQTQIQAPTPAVTPAAPSAPAPAPAPAPAAAAPAQFQAPLPATPAAAAAAPTGTPASTIKRFKTLSIKRAPKPRAPIPAPADKNTEHNLAHYKSLPTVGPENVDALHLMAVGTSIWALAAVGLSILLGATASRAAALEICLCGIVIGVLGMAWGGVHEYRKALGRGPLSENNSTPVDDVAAGEALSLRYRDI